MSFVSLKRWWDEALLNQTWPEDPSLFKRNISNWVRGVGSEGPWDLWIYQKWWFGSSPAWGVCSERWWRKFLRSPWSKSFSITGLKGKIWVLNWKSCSFPHQMYGALQKFSNQWRSELWDPFQMAAHAARARLPMKFPCHSQCRWGCMHANINTHIYIYMYIYIYIPVVPHKAVAEVSE